MCSVNRASSVRPKDQEKLVQRREAEGDENGAQRQQHRRPSGNRAALQPSSRLLQIRRRGAWKQCATDGQNDASRYATKPDHLHQQSQWESQERRCFSSFLHSSSAPFLSDPPLSFIYFFAPCKAMGGCCLVICFLLQDLFVLSFLALNPSFFCPPLFFSPPVVFDRLLPPSNFLLRAKQWVRVCCLFICFLLQDLFVLSFSALNPSLLSSTLLLHPHLPNPPGLFSTPSFSHLIIFSVQSNGCLLFGYLISSSGSVCSFILSPEH